MKFLKVIFIITISTIFLCSCAKEIDEVKTKIEPKDEELKKELETLQEELTNKIVTTVKTHEEETTILKIEIDEETTVEEIKNNEIESSSEETTILSAENETVVEGETSEEKDVDIERTSYYSNLAREDYQSTNAPTGEGASLALDSWNYGMSPIRWVYIEPNIQLISNNKPNSSESFGYKKKASSGSKGCYAPIFSRCDALGSDYDGRLYVFDDYTKVPVEEMLFENSFHKLEYEGHSIVDILSDKYDGIDIKDHVAKVGNNYINVVYVSELDEILGK